MPEEPKESRYATAMKTRRSVLGDKHVDRSLSNQSPLDSDFQKFITETAWGSVWSRPGLDKRTRHLITIALLAGLGREHELELHLKSIQNTYTTPEDVVEALLHVAIYAGIPASNSALSLLRKTVESQASSSEQ